MSFYPAARPVDVLTRTVTGTDGDGNDVYAATTTTVQDCVLWPLSSTEGVQGADTVIIGVNCLMPPGTVVHAVDRVSVEGVVYDVVGEPFAFHRNPFTGFDAGVTVQLRRVTG